MRRTNLRSVPVAAFLSLWIIATGQTSSPALGQTVPATVITVTGETHSGRLAAFDADHVTLAIDNQPRSFPLADLLMLRFDHPRIKPELSGAALFLANGDRLMGQVEHLNETAALVQWVEFPGWKSVSVPLEMITGLILEIPEVRERRSQVLRTVMDRRKNADVVDLKNGDQAAGELIELNPTELRLNGPVGETKIARSSIRSLTMNRELISFPKPDGQAFLLSLTDGSRLTVNQLTLGADNRLTAQALFGASLDLPLSAVVSVRCLGGRAVFLSDLKPADYQFTPYLSSQWELRTDRNVLGEPLRLKGIEYPKGLGQHSRSRVSYELSGAYQSFRAIVGIDDAADNGGSVTFAVDVDGTNVFKSEKQTGQDPPLTLPPIALADAKRLTLIVDFAEFGDVRDYADWCEAVLIKEGAKGQRSKGAK